eukprot:TRINITY_DN7114_c0_g3_i15.p1 TRINITY_DN7114_c0_g3~~TRINITY_DN7114_c0_g3_i15.p1  ORF type:complete len:132 (+),score=10.03 TRINITY_DN7114_c0_g3_i15:224-619(+)
MTKTSKMFKALKDLCDISISKIVSEDIEKSRIPDSDPAIKGEIMASNDHIEVVIQRITSAYLKVKKDKVKIKKVFVDTKAIADSEREYYKDVIEIKDNIIRGLQEKCDIATAENKSVLEHTSSTIKKPYCN